MHCKESDPFTDSLDAPRQDLMARYIGTWQQVKNTYGSGLPDEHLRSMVLNMLPERVQNDLVHRTELKTLQQMIDFVLLDIKRWQDQTVARAHVHHLGHSLSIGPKAPSHTLMQLHDDDDDK